MGNVSGAKPPDPATDGLFEALLLDWAEAHNVANELNNLGQLAYWTAAPWSRGIFLYSLFVDNKLLASWSDFIAEADDLVSIGRALTADPTLLSSFPPVSPILAAKLSRHHNESYLATAFSIAYPQTPTPFGDARRFLCLWLLVHGFDRAVNHNSCADRHLRRVANALSNFQNATSSDFEVLEAVTHRVGDDVQFFDLNRRIRANAERYLQKVRRESLRGEQLLRAIIKVAAFESAPDRASSEAVQFAKPAPGKSIPSTDFLFNALDPSIANEFDQELLDANPRGVVGDDEDAEDILELEIAEGTSSEEQDYVARGILLLTAEQRQFLPWTWTTPNFGELLFLRSWIDEHLSGPDETLSMLAAILDIGIASGRNLPQVLGMRISDEADEEWSVSLTHGELRRSPPMRKGGWRPKSEKEEAWIRSPARIQVIALSPEVVSAIRQSVGQRAPSSLRQAWKRIAKTECEEVASRLLRAQLPRLHLSMIGRALLQREFQASGDDVRARLMSAAPNTGLPAAAAYGNWTLPDITTAATERNARIVLGSRLDPLERQLVEAIAEACKTIEAWRSGDPVRFHNSLVAMLAIQLLAATGVRPVRDVFESPEHINLELAFAFVNDKASGDGRQGRLVLLPYALCEYLANEYRRHLAMVAGLLNSAHPELASQVRLLATGASAQLPLLFFIEQTNDGVRWTSVSEKSIADLKLFSWPLPLNLFRHRLAQRLCRHGLSREIIDGLLGHAEIQTESYSDHSFRCWQEDMELARPAIESVFKALRFQPITSWVEAPTALAATTEPLPLASSFGIRERELQRQKTRKYAFLLAKQTIDETLGDRQLQDLSDDELYDLSRKLLLDRNGKTSIAGNLRYSYLLARIKQLERKGRPRAKLKRRYFLNTEATTLCTALAVNADSILSATEKRLESGWGSLPAGISRADALMYRRLAIVVGLALRLRLSNFGFLKDLLKGRNCRLVKAGGRVHVEFGVFEETSDSQDVPCQRYPVASADVGNLCEMITLQMDDGYVDRWATDACKNLLADHPGVRGKDQATLSDLLKALAGAIDQSNIMSRSGVEAGVLAGRVMSYSPTWPDFVFLETGQRRVFDAEAKEDASNSGIDGLSSPPPALLKRQPSPMSGEGLAESAKAEASMTAKRVDQQDAAMRFVKDLRSIVNGRLPSTLHPEQTSNKARKAMLTRAQRIPKLSALIAYFRGQVGEALILIGEWAIHLMSDKSASRRISGIDRYLDALIPPFVKTAYAADMTRMDSDSLTELYGRVMLAVDAKGKQYVASRLHQFHRWAEGSDYGIAPVEWAELPDFPAQVGVSPGLVSEEEYRAARSGIQRSPDLGESDRLVAGWLLVAGYRFGLRIEEAWGLLRSDLIDVQGRLVVLIAKNHLRTLKRFGSRRQVPLVFPLTPDELVMLDTLKASADSRHGDKVNVGLIADAAGKMPELTHLSRVINQTIKHVTGNRRHSYHHLRHSFGTRLAGALIGRSPVWFEMLGWHYDDVAEIRQCVSGDTKCSKRIAWAIARMLGHMGPTTSFRSYIHGLVDMAAGGQSWHDPVDIKHPVIADLDALNRYVPLASDEGIRETDVLPLTYLRIVQYLRLLSRGWDWERAARHLQIDLSQGGSLYKVVSAVGRNQKLGKTCRDDRNDPHDMDFLKRITNDGWLRLLNYSLPPTKANPQSGMLDRLKRVVGETRQLVMCSELDVDLVGSLILSAGIPHYRFDIVASSAASDRLIGHAADNGLSAVRLKELMEQRKALWNERRQSRQAKKSMNQKVSTVRKARGREKKSDSPRYNSLQIDRGWMDDEREISASGRLALIFKEQRGEAPVNAIELIVIFIAVAGLSLIK